MLADHCARSPGLRLTPDGYLTGDFNLDMPPMKCVLIDPYTGQVLVYMGRSKELLVSSGSGNTRSPNRSTPYVGMPRIHHRHSISAASKHFRPKFCTGIPYGNSNILLKHFKFASITNSKIKTSGFSAS